MDLAKEPLPHDGFRPTVSRTIEAGNSESTLLQNGCLHGRGAEATMQNDYNLITEQGILQMIQPLNRNLGACLRNHLGIPGAQPKSLTALRFVLEYAPGHPEDLGGTHLFPKGS